MVSHNGELVALKYARHLLIAIITTRNSFSYADSFWLCKPKALLKYATVWPPWMSTTLMPVSHASVLMLNGLAKSGRVSTGALAMVHLRRSKVVCAYVVHSNPSFIRRFFSGLVMMP